MNERKEEEEEEKKNLKNEMAIDKVDSRIERHAIVLDYLLM